MGNQKKGCSCTTFVIILLAITGITSLVFPPMFIVTILILFGYVIAASIADDLTDD